jgi:signal transduction histidine kinase
VTGASVRAVVAVENRMFRALAVLRVVVLVNAVALTAYRNNFDRPVAGWVCLGVMVGWTVYAIVTYAKPVRRTVRLLVADLGIAVALMAVTPVVKGEWFNATIPGFWVMGALLAWAVRYGWRGGLVAAVALGVTDRLIRADYDQGNYANLFLIVIGGPLVGYLAESLQQMAAERDLAQREAAAATERARLARVVHDGVLQVLALVQRRGAELGGEAAELGRLAGEQEQNLRHLIRSQDQVTAAGRPGTEDLAAALGRLAARPGVELALPAGPVDLPAPAVAELVAVVGACLDNVTRHVGADAPAWVLLEDLGDRVAISVRDEGDGIPAGRLDVARAEGRLGVSESIEGRVRDLGGTATLTTGEFGTEWELVVPKA